MMEDSSPSPLSQFNSNSDEFWTYEVDGKNVFMEFLLHDKCYRVLMFVLDILSFVNRVFCFSKSYCNVCG